MTRGLRLSLGVLAQVGVVLYMFLVDAELGLSRLRKLAPSMAISHASIIAPFLLGSALGCYTRSPAAASLRRQTPD